MIGDALNTTKWLPAPADKYLPIWVIAAMFLSVLMLSWLMKDAIEDICLAQPDKCQKLTPVATSAVEAPKHDASANAGTTASQPSSIATQNAPASR